MTGDRSQPLSAGTPPRNVDNLSYPQVGESYPAVLLAMFGDDACDPTELVEHIAADVNGCNCDVGYRCFNRACRESYAREAGIIR